MQKNVYIRTFGCSLNHSDSEVMGGLLMKSGFDVVSAYGGEDSTPVPENVDIVLINSCTVKNLAESKFLKELRYWKGKNVKIVVAGCIPQADKDLLDTDLKDVSVIGTRQITRVVDIIKRTLDGEIVHDISDGFNERLKLPKIRKNKIIEIIPILEGCFGNCSFCKTKFARGELHSYPKEKILAQFKDALDDGCKEFWITSQDDGCYGFDIYRKEKYFLPQLLQDMLSVQGEFRIRLGMCNPDHIDRIKEDLVDVFKHPKMFKFLHIPIQSGDDAVLSAMKRSYTIDDVTNIIDMFRSRIPDIVISTDIIVGFPGETKKAFENTLSIINRCNFDVLNISRFWPRKGTDAIKMKQLPSHMLIDRSKTAKMLFDRLAVENNTRLIGKSYKILIDDIGDVISGRTDNYKHVIVSDSSDLSDGLRLGDFVDVMIVSSTKYHLYGKIVR